jgi:hypothetical protein
MITAPKFMPASPEAAARYATAKSIASNAEAISALEQRLLQLTLAHEELSKRVEHLEKHSKPIERVW